MSIITLFCEIDDLFLAAMKYQTEYHRPNELHGVESLLTSVALYLQEGVYRLPA